MLGVWRQHVHGEYGHGNVHHVPSRVEHLDAHRANHVHVCCRILWCRRRVALLPVSSGIHYHHHWPVRVLVHCWSLWYWGVDALHAVPAGEHANLCQCVYV